MNFKYYIILSFFSLLISAKIVDRSDDIRPFWSREAPQGVYYNYYSGVGYSSKSLMDAKTLAESDVISSLLNSNEFSVKSIITTKKNQSQNNIFNEVSRQIEQTTPSIEIEGFTKEEEYWEILRHKPIFSFVENKTYRYWVLMKQRKPEYLDLDEINILPDQSYGTTPVIKSALVPGWGQSHKGQKLESIKFLSSFILSMTIGYISKGFSDNYSQDAREAVGGEWINYYNQLSEQYYLVSRLSYSLAAGIYGYNIYHSISTKGAKIYALNNNINLHFSLSVDNLNPIINFKVSS